MTSGRKLLAPALLGAFLAFHLTAITLRALPAPDGALDRAAWSNPTVQEELEAWRLRLARFGLKMERQPFQDAVYALAEDGAPG